jgi:hypothetical protein
MMAVDENSIIRYLLGDSSEGAASAIEERYFVDRAFFEHVAAVEDLLIQDYLNHSLSPRDVELFENKYLKVPELREKVAFARRLRAAAAASRVRGTWPGGRWVWPRWMTMAAPAFAALGLVFLAASWLLVHHYSLRRAAGLAPGPLSTGSTLAGLPAQPGTDSIVALVLNPGLAKGAGPLPQRLLLTPGLKEIRLELNLPGRGEDNLVARVEGFLVENERLELVWSRDGLPSAPTLRGRAVLVSLRPEDLFPGDYLVYLRRSGTPPQGPPLQSYALGVVRR